jgi:hypothetical protein
MFTSSRIFGMRGEVVAFGLASSRPRGGENAAASLKSTPRIGHVVRRYRWSDLKWKGIPQVYSGAKEVIKRQIRTWLSK